MPVPKALVACFDSDHAVGWGFHHPCIIRSGMDLFEKSVTVSIAVQKYGTLSTKPIISDKLKPTSCSSVGLCMGRRKVVKGVYST